MFYRSNKSMSANQKKVAKLLQEKPHTPGDVATKILGWTEDKWFKEVVSQTKFFDFSGVGWFIKEENKIC